jgi:hypothetical protein
LKNVDSETLFRDGLKPRRFTLSLGSILLKPWRSHARPTRLAPEGMYGYFGIFQP